MHHQSGSQVAHVSVHECAQKFVSARESETCPWLQ